jgi:DHA1 family inner membrane transport protein
MSEFDVSRSLRALALSYFAVGTSALSVIGALSAIAHGLGLGANAVAGLVSAYAIVFAVTVPLLQVVAARLPRRTLILAGLALSAAGAAGSAVATGYAALFAARVLVALGGAAIGPVASALGATLVPRERQGRALATVFSGMTLASVLATPAAEWFSAQFGWRAMFGAIALLNVAIAIAVQRWVKDRGIGQALSIRALAAELRRPAVAAGVAVMVLYTTGLFSTFTMVVPMLQQRFAMSHHLVSAALMIFGLAGVAGNFVAKRLGDRVNADRLIALSLVALIAAFVLFQLVPAWAAVAIALMLVWACSNDLFMPSQQRRLAEIAPQARGLVLALNSSALYIGMSAGSVLSGAVTAHVGLGALPIVSAVVLVLALVALWISRQAMRAPGTTLAPCC